MYAAVHSDRSGRVFVANDYGAAAYEGVRSVALATAIPLPDGTELIPIEREAVALDRAGRPRGLGRTRWALAALLPRGYVRTRLPAYRDDPASNLEPRTYAAVAAAPGGELVVAARSAGGAPPRSAPSGEVTIARALRGRPANKLLRQLARCAREDRCLYAGSLFAPTELAIPLGAPSNERPRLPAAPRLRPDERPSEPAAFRPSAEEVAEVGIDHLAAGGEVRFGAGCDGEPLLLSRVVEEAVRAMRAASERGRIRIETNGSSPASLRRVLAAGVGEVTIRLASAHPQTYELLHGPEGYRWTDVRASLQIAASGDASLTVALHVLPGLSDRASERDALLALLDELPRGTLELRDLAADPLRTLAGLAPGTPEGVETLLGALGEVEHFRLASSYQSAPA